MMDISLAPLIHNLLLAFALVPGTLFALSGLPFPETRLCREIHATDLQTSRLRVEEMASRIKDGTT